MDSQATDEESGQEEFNRRRSDPHQEPAGLAAQNGWNCDGEGALAKSRDACRGGDRAGPELEWIAQQLMTQAMEEGVSEDEDGNIADSKDPASSVIKCANIQGLTSSKLAGESLNQSPGLPTKNGSRPSNDLDLNPGRELSASYSAQTKSLPAAVSTLLAANSSVEAAVPAVGLGIRTTARKPSAGDKAPRAPYFKDAAESHSVADTSSSRAAAEGTPKKLPKTSRQHFVGSDACSTAEKADSAIAPASPDIAVR